MFSPSDLLNRNLGAKVVYFFEKRKYNYIKVKNYASFS